MAAMHAPRLLARGASLPAVFVFTLGFVAAQPAAPQLAPPPASSVAPRPIARTDFDTWRSLGAPHLTRDGRWLAYASMPQDADGDVIARELATGRELRVPVGALPAPAAAPGEENTNPEAPPTPRAIRLLFTSDGRYLVANSHPAKADVLAARKAKKKPEEFPKDGLVIVELASGAITRVADVKSFAVPAKGGAWLAI
ncbi:MAG: hypothetical protein RLZZ15_46 [Verrucomicrobiota bacterium]|jgi:hypothetical protein